MTFTYFWSGVLKRATFRRVEAGRNIAHVSKFLSKVSKFTLMFVLALFNDGKNPVTK